MKLNQQKEKKGNYGRGSRRRARATARELQSSGTLISWFSDLSMGSLSFYDQILIICMYVL